MKTFRIFSASPSDIPSIQFLLRQTWKDTYGDHLSQATLDEVYENWQSVEFLTRQIQNPQMYFPIAKENESGEVAGLATAHVPTDLSGFENTIQLFRLYVLPQYQRQGIGEMLLNDVIAHFPTAHKIQLHVEAMNPKGQNFYKKHGFRELRRESETVVNEVIEQILMEKRISQ